MNDPGSPPSADAPEQALAATMPQVLGPPVASLNAVQAAHRIIAWHGVAKAIFTMIHAEIMQAAWIIRREHPEREDFDRFAEAHGLTDVMSPDRAWLAAETWEVARDQRSLLAVVTERPEEAMRFVWEFVSAGAERQLKRLEKDDSRIAGVLALPPRKRNSEIQRLIELEQAVSDGRHPDDVRRIDELEAERAAGPGTAAALEHHPAAFVNELAAAERTLADLAERMGQWHDAPGRAVSLGAARCNRAMLACDMAIGSLDRISEIVQIAANEPQDTGAA